MFTKEQNAKRVEKAKVQLLFRQPFFGVILYRAEIKPSTTCGPTLANDGFHIWYNPDFVPTIPDEQLQSELAHEAMHIALLHAPRKRGRDHKKWNNACDFAINPILHEAGMKLGSDWLLDMEYNGKSADEIYNIMPQKPGKGACCGHLRLPPKGTTTSQIKQQEMEMQIALSQAASVAKMRGKLPGSLERFVDAILHPVVDWESLLRRFFEHAARNDYNWGRPSRRWLSSGVYLPSLYNNEMGPVVIFVDTSGSVSGREVQRFASEITAIMETMRPEVVYVVYVDSAVAGVEVFYPEDMPIQLHPKGGGGTSFKPGFKWVEENGIEPTCAIYYTDMCCDEFPARPSYPVLWASSAGACGWHSGHVPFGEVIDLQV